MAFTDDFESYTPGDNLGSAPNWTSLGPLDDIEIASDGSDQYLVVAGAGSMGYLCPDQGDADHYLAIKKKDFDSSGGVRYCVRFVDYDNYVCYRQAGAGGAGRRLTKRVNGVDSDIVTSQGVAGEWIKVEVEGEIYRFYEGGTGATPSWTQVGADQTISDSEISTAETSIGIRNDASSPVDLITYFEAGALGGGSTTVEVGLASETNFALPITAVQPVVATLGIASEASSALGITPIKDIVVSLGIAEESSSALPITATGDVIVALGIALDTSSALPITPIKDIVVEIGIASEANTALNITPTKAILVTLGIADEANSALSITPIKDTTITIGIATETDQALSITVGGTVVLQVSCTLVDTNGNALPNLANLSYAWFDEADPADFTSPVVQGGIESTDGTGEIVVPIAGTSLSAGGVGTLVLRSDDGALFGAYNLEAAA